MWNGQKIVCVLPGYNAEKTLEKTVADVSPGIVDLFIYVDDASTDKSFEIAQQLAQKFPMRVARHEKNLGPGANEKTCYSLALEAGADIIVVLHPDFQYEPKLLNAMVAMVAEGVYDLVLGSRILGKGALKGGMPLYKYVANRFLTLFENILIGQRLSDFHTGYRAYTRKVLEEIPFHQNSNDFVFGNEFLVQSHVMGFRIGEISVPTRYFEEASSMNFRRCVKYGFEVIPCAFSGFLARWGIWRGCCATLQSRLTHLIPSQPLQ